jgi:hypothetical protein
MTIRKKLCEPLGKYYIETSKELEQIADDYAIEFVEWLYLDDTQDLIYSLQMVGELPKIPKTKELLEIFKKEKGL